MMAPPAESPRLRVAFLALIVVSLMSALVLRLWFLQVLSVDNYRVAAVQNQVRIVPVQPARGNILDRNGAVLVKNRPSLVVSIRPDALAHDRAATIARLAQVLSITPAEIESRLADKRVLPYAAIPVAQDVPEQSVVYILEHRDQFPGVVPETRPVRVYPQATLAAHLLGYVGEISPDQLKDPRYAGIREGASVGRSGLEYAYEKDLHGKEGLVKLQVDAAGKVKGEPLGTLEAEPGYDLVSTIDSNIQTLTEQSLQIGIEKARSAFDKESQKHYLATAGGAVVLDPRNGEILASASYPSFDPRMFIGGISRADFAKLSTDPAKPLLDRVTEAALPPGSTFKIVTAAAALQDGLTSPGARIDCPSSVRLYDQTFKNWRASDAGAISLPQALIDSCDTVFYGFGAEFWRRFHHGQGERLQDYAREFSFGSPTGVELPFEDKGLVPDEGWLKEVHARMPQAFPYKIWLPGYTINMSIGQGDLKTTPLQLATAYAAIANGGTVFRPHVGLRIMNGSALVRNVEPDPARRLTVSASNLDLIRRGLEGVAPYGTAKGAFSGFPFSTVAVGSKTGTAELQTIPPKQPYAWFVAYAPAQNPRYLVAVMLEEAGHGGETAAPVARRILEGLFGLPLSDINPAAKTD